MTFKRRYKKGTLTLALTCTLAISAISRTFVSRMRKGKNWKQSFVGFAGHMALPRRYRKCARKDYLAFDSEDTDASNYTDRICYAFSLFFILSIADLTERKNLILTMILLSIISLLGMYLSLNFISACVACLAVGVTSAIPQLLLPQCAKLSDEHKRAKNIGHIMSRLLTGVVLSRVVSGSVGKYLGWKSIYIIAVIFMAMLKICTAPKVSCNERSGV